MNIRISYTTFSPESGLHKDYTHNWRKLQMVFFPSLKKYWGNWLQVIFLFLLRHRFSWTLILPRWDKKIKVDRCRVTHLWHPAIVFSSFFSFWCPIQFSLFFSFVRFLLPNSLYKLASLSPQKLFLECPSTDVCSRLILESEWCKRLFLSLQILRFK